MSTILAAVDFSPATPGLIEFVAGLAIGRNGKTYLVHVAAPEPDFVGYDVGPATERDAIATRFRREHRELQDLADGLRARGLDATALLVQGPTVEKLLAEAARLHATHIVVGSHGRGAVGRLLLGSVSEGLVRHTSVPVTVIPFRPLQ